MLTTQLTTMKTHNGQPVYVLPYMGTGPKPWPTGYIRVLRPLGRFKADVLIVRMANLKEK